jgi:hypothetical protein
MSVTYCNSVCQSQDWKAHAFICGKGTKREREEEEEEKFDLEAFPKDLLPRLIDFLPEQDAKTIGAMNPKLTYAYRLLDFPRRVWHINKHTFERYQRFAAFIYKAHFSKWKWFKLWPGHKVLKVLTVQEELKEPMAIDCPQLETFKGTFNSQFFKPPETLKRLRWTGKGVANFASYDQLEYLDIDPKSEIVIEAFPPNLTRLFVSWHKATGWYEANLSYSISTRVQCPPFPPTLKVLYWGIVHQPFPHPIPLSCTHLGIGWRDRNKLHSNVEFLQSYSYDDTCDIRKEDLPESLRFVSMERFSNLNGDEPEPCNVISLPSKCKSLVYNSVYDLQLSAEVIPTLKEVYFDSLDFEVTMNLTIPDMSLFRNCIRFNLAYVRSVSAPRISDKRFFKSLHPDLEEFQVHTLSFFENETVHLKYIPMKKLRKLRLVDDDEFEDEGNKVSKVFCDASLDNGVMELLWIDVDTLKWSIEEVSTNTLLYLSLNGRSFASRVTFPYPPNLRVVEMYRVKGFPWPDTKPFPLIGASGYDAPAWVYEMQDGGEMPINF